jgi:DNA-directed RNA polymerase specialized sigma24 family protein
MAPAKKARQDNIASALRVYGLTLPPERVDKAELPDQRLCRAEVKSLILNAVMALTSRYQQALVMKYLEDRRAAA